MYLFLFFSYFSFVFYTCVDLAITSLFRPLCENIDDDIDDDDSVQLSSVIFRVA